MAKMYKKSDLKFVDGYLVDGDSNVVALPGETARQINELETHIQKLAYLDDQPKGRPERSLDGFKRKSTQVKPMIKVDTPTLDQKVAEGRKILGEIRDMDKAKQINEMLDMYSEAFSWFRGEMFVEGSEPVRIDTPEIGDILEVDANELIDEIVSYMD